MTKAAGNTRTKYPTGPADVLDLAADLISERGWAKWDFITNDGRMCMAGALCAASGLNPTNAALPADSSQALRSSLRQDYGSSGITSMNDGFFTRKRQAVSALRRAAKRLRGEKVRPLPSTR